MKELDPFDELLRRMKIIIDEIAAIKASIPENKHTITTFRPDTFIQH